MFGFNLFGESNILSTSDLERETRRDSFSKYLPWGAYDPETKVYLNADSTVGFLWECAPLSFCGDKTERTLEGLFRINFPEDTVIQFILVADDKVDPILDAYKRLKRRNSKLVTQSADELCRFMRNSTSGMIGNADTPLRNFRLFVSIKMPIDKKALQGLSPENIQTSMKEILQGANLCPKAVSPSVLVDWMRRLFNDEESQNNNHYDEEVPIRKQIIFSETQIKEEFSCLRLGKKKLRCITPKVFPKEVELFDTNLLFGGVWGVSSDADQVKTPFIYTLNIVFQDMKAQLHTKCNLVLQQQGVGSWAPALARKQQEYMQAADQLEAGKRFFKIVPLLWVYGEDDRKVDESVQKAKRLWETQGYVMQEDRGILKSLFIAALPFGLYNVKTNLDRFNRDFIVPEETLTAVLPVQSDFAGVGGPALLFVGRKGQIGSLDIYDKTAINHNAFVTATTGSGKSFFVNYLAFNYYGTGAKVRIVDIGGSYKKMAKMLDARYLEFSKENKVCLNPFSNIENEEFDLQIIPSIVAQMIYSASDNPQPTETEMTLIKNAVRWAYKHEGQKAEIDTVYRYLNEFPKHDKEISDKGPIHKEIRNLKTRALELAFNLKEFTSSGIYGWCFNGPADFNIATDDFVVLELERLMPQKELFKVVTLQVINAVTQDLYLSDRSKPRLVIFDEAWQFIKQGGAIGDLKEVIEVGYRRARKYGGSFTIVTQSLLDLKGFGPVGDVIRGNSAFKFYLESEDFEKAAQEKLIEEDEFLLEMLKTLHTQPGKYSEVFMKTPTGMGVCRLIVDPFSYYVCTSTAREVAEIEKMVEKQGISYPQAIREMVKKYRG